VDTTELARVLRSVPECKLRLIALAAEVTRDDGSLDADKITFLDKELKEAVDEAKEYARNTQELVTCLVQLARSSS
jgi:hypothetical protein